MRCEDVFDLMNRELDGDLAEEEQKQLQGHLRQCSDCTELFKGLQSVSNELAALPQIEPPYSIVDSILPALEELDQENRQNIALTGARPETSSSEHSLETQAKQEKQPSKRKKSWKKNWWIPGSVVAAGFLTVYIFSIGSDLSGDMASEEIALYESAVNSESNADRAEPAQFGIAAQDQEDLERSAEEEKQVEANMEKGLVSAFEYSVFLSPDGKYEARFEAEEGRVFINLSSGEEYYKSQISWKEPWKITTMEWVSNDMVYVELYDAENDAYQYWTMDIQEKQEEQLEGPYPFNSSNP